MDLAEFFLDFSVRCLVVHLTKNFNLQSQFAVLRPPTLVHTTFGLLVGKCLCKAGKERSRDKGVRVRRVIERTLQIKYTFHK